MAKIKIYRRTMTADELKALLALVESAGCELSDVEIIEEIGEPAEDCEDEVILVLAKPDICDNPEFEAELGTVPNQGRRAVCIWPKGAEGFELPAAAKKFCYSIVSWDAEHLRTVLGDDDKVCFESSSGEPLPKVETERNLCVQEPKKPK